MIVILWGFFFFQEKKKQIKKKNQWNIVNAKNIIFEILACACESNKNCKTAEFLNNSYCVKGGVDSLEITYQDIMINT